MVTLAVVIVVMLGLLIGFHSRRAYWCLNVYKGPSPGREDDIDESTGTGMYAVMLRYAEFMMEVEKQREAGGMTIDQMVDEAKNNPDKTVYFEKGRLVYVSSGIMLEDLEVRDGRADYAGWGKRMDKRFGQSLGWDFGGYGLQSSGGEGLLGSMWNSPFARWLVPDKLSFSIGGDVAAFIGVGAQPVNFSILTRGKEPGVYLTPTFTVNAGIGATASGGFSFGVSTYTGDPRNITSSMLSGSSHGGMITGGFLGDISIGGSRSSTGNGNSFINGSIGIGIGFGAFGGYQYQYTPGAGKLWGW